MERNCPYCHQNHFKRKYSAGEIQVVQCRECGYVYTLDPGETDPAGTYNDYFHESDVITPDAGNGPDSRAFAIYEKRLQIVQGLKKSGSLLEVGCGRGYFLARAKEAGYRTTGIEISPAAAHYAGLHYDLDVRVGDFETMQPPDETFDIIALWHVLEHFRDPLSVLESLFHLLNENGILVIEAPNLNSLKFRVSGMARKWQGGNHPRFHLSFFTNRTLKKMLFRAGFPGISYLYIDYPGQNNFLKSVVKKCLNRMYLDSFIAVIVYKR